MSCIPSVDRAFANAALVAFMDVEGSVEANDMAGALADLLRPTYPTVEVHRQDLLARVYDDDVWYVYRDGKVFGSGGPG